MKLADVSVRRPVFAVMMSVALVVLGWFSYGELGLDLMPRTDSRRSTSARASPGASAEEIETTITKPIEAAVNTINGIDELRCSSNQGNGNCTITFTLERDIEAATQDVRDKVATVRFPRDTNPPVVSKSDPGLGADARRSSCSRHRSPKEITQIADKQIKQVLETVQDVGEVSFFGDRRREIRILLESRPRAMRTASRSTRSAAPSPRQNTEIPGGSFISGPSEISMRTMGRLRDVERVREDRPRVQGRLGHHARRRRAGHGQRTRRCAARPGSTARTRSRCRSASSRARTRSTVVDRVHGARGRGFRPTLPAGHPDRGRRATSRSSSASRSRKSSSTWSSAACSRRWSSSSSSATCA